MLHQLGGLDDQRHREILGRMKLLPVAFARELAQAFFQVFEGFHDKISMGLKAI